MTQLYCSNFYKQVGLYKDLYSFSISEMRLHLAVPVWSITINEDDRKTTVLLLKGVVITKSVQIIRFGSVITSLILTRITVYNSGRTA